MTINQCVYALTHIKTGKVYIGSTMNFYARRAKWREKLRYNPQNLPPTFSGLTRSREDWVFSILWDGTDATIQELEVQERHAVALLAAKAPSRCLNTMAVYRPDAAGFTAGGQTMSLNAWSRSTGIPRVTISARIRLGWTPEQCVGLKSPPVRNHRADALASMDRQRALDQMATAILDDSGKPMLIGEAATALRCGHETLRRRLAKRRVRHSEPSVTLAELRALTDKYGKWSYRP